jgi:dTDP-4-amino-4,6-dideoxygalactose transaminase
LPVAERACRELLALPIHPALAPGAIEYVVDRIAAFYRIAAIGPTVAVT